MSENEPLLPQTAHNPTDPNEDEDWANLKRHERWQKQAGEQLESDRVHKFIILLSLIDACIVITDLAYVFLNQPCSGEEPELPWWLEVLSNVSTAITLSFLVEIPLALWAFGWKYYWPTSNAYPHPGFHLLDAVVIVGSVVIDLGLRGRDKELASLLIVFRLWRIIKVVGGVAVGVNEYNESAEIELREKKKEVEHLQLRIKELETENAALKQRAQL